MGHTTERPITIHVSTNHLVGPDMNRLQDHVRAVLSGRGKRGAVPPLWDGQAAERIASRMVGRQ